MSGLKLVIPNFVSTNPNLPVLREDKRLTAGSLLLIDFSHQLSPTEIPANASPIKNLAYKEAMSLIATTSEAGISPVVSNSITQSGGLMQFTEKKGLHGIISQVNDSAGSNDFVINIPQTIINYINANIARGFFVSIWSRKTRLATTSTSANFCLGVANTSNYIAAFQTGGSGYIGNNLGSRGSATTLNSLSPQCNNLAVSVKTGTITTEQFGSIFKFGSGGVFSGFETNKACSEILYQIHIMDLTSAGLTYSQADALDLANFNQAFSAGGRFANDTFTSPSTLL